MSNIKSTSTYTNNLHDISKNVSPSYGDSADFIGKK